jgi:hypothetical protein
MIWPALLIGLVSSFFLLRLFRPLLVAPWRWAWRGLVLHVAIWGAAYAALTLLLGRPWFAMALCLAGLLLLVQVNNAKFHALREPFVFQDFEYFTDAIKHPRLYIPFLGWGKFFLIVLGVCVALGIGIGLETPLPERLEIDGVLGRLLGLLMVSLCGIVLAREGVSLTFSPVDDLNCAGLLGALWSYGRAERQAFDLPDAFSAIAESGSRPHIIAVQSESFFDPRRIFPGIRRDVLANFDRVSAEAEYHGYVSVPAWGANTVRSEFAFLSGLTESELGVHRFNPFRRVLNARVRTLAHVMRERGYRTVCLHPYPASFYGRDQVYPHLGFDAFIDIAAFADAPRAGPYVADAALLEKISSIIDSSDRPVFLFVITMENHGPLHLEKVDAGELPAYYDQSPPVGCDDLTIYLRHLKNADQMIGKLTDFLSKQKTPSVLCWYGDHVPIMPRVYETYGLPDGRTPFFIWNGKAAQGCGISSVDLTILSHELLEVAFQSS